MKAYYEHGGITIYHGDCREILPSLPKGDCFLTDPFYGIGNDLSSGNARENGRTAYEVTSGWEDSESAVVAVVIPVIRCLVDAGLRGAVTPGNKCLFCYPRPSDLGCFFAPACNGISRWGMISTHPILYYGKPPYTWQTGWPRGTFPTGRATRGLSPDTDHPCPKPINDWQWLLSKISLPGELVIDPFVGSGTTLIVAKSLGRRAIGIDIEESACEESAKRLSQEVFDFAAALSADVQP